MRGMKGAAMYGPGKENDEEEEKEKEQDDDDGYDPDPEDYPEENIPDRDY
jgi:hypothetical protein